MDTNKNKQIHHYFVDEAGDLTLFDKKGRQIVGTPGVSRFFMVGVAHLSCPKRADIELGNLRSRLLADPYFKGVPSMQPHTRKSAICFHASKDLPEVRREVFSVLPNLWAKVQVAIRRKKELATDAKSSYEKFGTKFSANDIYDGLVKRLFKNLLHKADENRIIVARRGKADRLEALNSAIYHAKLNFEKKWNIKARSQISISSAHSHEFIGLQVIDYYLWALQRLYERGEDRFFNLLAPRYRLIMDVDDKREKPYGQWYTDQNPLTAQKIKPSEG